MAEIFYTTSPDLHRLARIEKGEVVELDFEFPNKPPSLLGGIYWGRVVEIQKPLQAAFVDIGLEKPGLLPLRERGFPPVTQGENVSVQVVRTENPVEDKGVRLTRSITLSRGALLFTPLKPGLSFSKKIKDREPFKKVLALEKGEGLIVRFGAKPDSHLSQDLDQLRKEWADIQKASEKTPSCLLPSPDLLTRALRGLTPSDCLFVDDPQIFARTKGKAQLLHKKAFDERCEEAWESLFSPQIDLQGGGNLYIEETRGANMIDVNSEGSLNRPLPFNRGAVREVFRQLRLRDLGGKIIVDLIHPSGELPPLLQGIEIPSSVEIGGISPLGFLELIRRKRRLSLPARLKMGVN